MLHTIVNKNKNFNQNNNKMVVDKDTYEIVDISKDWVTVEEYAQNIVNYITEKYDTLEQNAVIASIKEGIRIKRQDELDKMKAQIEALQKANNSL